jgi:hypothetical protein
VQNPKPYEFAGGFALRPLSTDLFGYFYFVRRNRPRETSATDHTKPAYYESLVSSVMHNTLLLNLTLHALSVRPTLRAMTDHVPT